MPTTNAKIVQSPTGWSLQYLTGPLADAIRNLFGTDTLPLPLGPVLTLPEVIAEVSKTVSGVVMVDDNGGVILR